MPPSQDLASAPQGRRKGRKKGGADAAAAAADAGALAFADDDPARPLSWQGRQVVEALLTGFDTELLVGGVGVHACVRARACVCLCVCVRLVFVCNLLLLFLWGIP